MLPVFEQTPQVVLDGCFNLRVVLVRVAACATDADPEHLGQTVTGVAHAAIVVGLLSRSR